MGARFIDFNENIIASRGYKALSQSLKVSQDELILPYGHTTFSVSNVAEYLEVVNIIHNANRDIFSPLIYRGMSNAAWSLTPSLGRFGDDYAFMEHDFVNEMLTLRPEEFRDLSTPFDLVAKLQHFGIPTRLLDFTLNPLVALYFAVNSERSANNKCGRVVITVDRNSTHSRELIDAICGFYDKFLINDYLIDNLLPEGISVEDYLRANIGLFTLKPAYANERIKRQSAIFMIFPNDISDRYATLYKFYDKKGMYIFDEEYRNVLKYEDLDSIYDGDYLSIDCVSRDQIEKIIRSYDGARDIKCENRTDIKAAMNKNLKNRFTVCPSLKEIDPSILNSSFASVIIKPKYKAKILEELDRININESFLFPELEYTAKNVKERVVSQWREVGFPY